MNLMIVYLMVLLQVSELVVGNLVALVFFHPFGDHLLISLLVLVSLHPYWLILGFPMQSFPAVVADGDHLANLPTASLWTTTADPLSPVALSRPDRTAHSSTLIHCTDIEEVSSKLWLLCLEEAVQAHSSTT